jgi:hypothetical protein
MKIKIISILCLLALAIGACQSNKESGEHNHDATSTSEAQPDTIKKSIPKEEHAKIGDTHLMIKYHAPAVRGRTIWGGLVPYGDVWVTGAHSATTLEVDKDFSTGGQNIPAGKYALFTIPGKEKWTVIINRNWEQHLADEYDSKDDVVRVELVPEILGSIQERLKYKIVANGNDNGVLTISWEKIKLSMPLELGG